MYNAAYHGNLSNLFNDTASVPGHIIPHFYLPRPVEVYAGAGSTSSHSDQSKWLLLGCFISFQCVSQCLGYEGTNANSLSLRRTPHTLCELVVQRDRHSHILSAYHLTTTALTC